MSAPSDHQKEEALEFVLGMLTGLGVMWGEEGFGALVAELARTVDEHAPHKEPRAPVPAEPFAAINEFRGRLGAALERLDLGQTERLCGELLDRMAAAEVPAVGERLRTLLEGVTPDALSPPAPRPVVAAVELLHTALGAAYGRAYDLAIVVGDTVIAARDRDGGTEIRPRAVGSEEGTG
ncbi:hypothetical protein [Polyangium sorediatum]|uniref:Uncharacterized protein n=1 Tax=Polyangium sorediatum TaxID=889274 RepID=A0ABT6NLC6_9BACT|nr:hypothetical protein [Polyangium sorediatum]MDI1429047.1 hypothetical protein [Polyangium sorediatum]